MKKAILTVCILAGLAAVSFFIPKETEDPGPMPKAQSEAVKQIGFYHYYSGALSGGISEMIDQVNQSQDRFVVSAH